MKKRTGFILFLLMAFAGCVVSNSPAGRMEKKSVIAEQESLYECYRIRKIPVIDGKLDDSCWQSIPAAKCFFLLGGREFAMVKPSFFKAGWDNENFYFGFVAQEPETQKITAKRQSGDKFLWTEDSVELFLFPPETDAWQFIVNAIGSRHNGKGDTGATTPLANWQTASFIGQNFWPIEVKIPFKIFGKTPVDGEQWKINVGRNNLTGPVEERVSCWPKIRKSFHEIENYGALIFKKGLLNQETVIEVENRINAVRYYMLKNMVVELVSAYNNEYKNYLKKASSIPSLSTDAEELKNIWTFAVDYYEKTKNKEINLEEIYRVLLKTKGLKEKTETLKQRIELESLFE
ncbi:MAG: hypothetical protein NC902_05760 [Candidatus Omnitrophica bacterium]|nr:hypothetical protein [Candidatus Omnitrophota bacterium]